MPISHSHKAQKAKNTSLRTSYPTHTQSALARASFAFKFPRAYIYTRNKGGNKDSHRTGTPLSPGIGSGSGAGLSAASASESSLGEAGESSGFESYRAAIFRSFFLAVCLSVCVRVCSWLERRGTVARAFTNVGGAPIWSHCVAKQIMSYPRSSLVTSSPPTQGTFCQTWTFLRTVLTYLPTAHMPPVVLAVPILSPFPLRWASNLSGGASAHC